MVAARDAAVTPEFLAAARNNSRFRGAGGEKSPAMGYFFRAHSHARGADAHADTLPPTHTPP